MKGIEAARRWFSIFDETQPLFKRPSHKLCIDSNHERMTFSTRGGELEPNR